MKLKRHLFWIIYSGLVIGVLSTHWDPKLFSMNQPMAFGKLLIWLVFVAFSVFTIHCSMTEKFMKSLRKIVVYKWGQQIGSDLIIGLFLSLFMVYWLTGSAIAVCLWLIPFIAFGNLATLLFFAINYDSLVSIFLNH